MSFEKAKEQLKKFNLENRILTFKESSATVLQASNLVGCTEGEIAKTLSFIVNDSPILIVIAGDAKVNNAKFKACFQTKAKMISFDEVENLIGHAVGGVCPFGVNENVLVYLDESLKKYNYVYPACGDNHSAVKLTIEELERASNYKSWVDVCL